MLIRHFLIGFRYGKFPLLVRAPQRLLRFMGKLLPLRGFVRFPLTQKQVVIDPTINPEQMEMYADVDARAGVLEPEGLVEIKMRRDKITLPFLTARFIAGASGVSRTAWPAHCPAESATTPPFSSTTAMKVAFLSGCLRRLPNWWLRNPTCWSR
jgi:hypothetical protein